jgi:hypothetical protein
MRLGKYTRVAVMIGCYGGSYEGLMRARFKRRPHTTSYSRRRFKHALQPLLKGGRVCSNLTMC